VPIAPRSEPELLPLAFQFNSLGSVSVPKFHPEYGRYMLESTPGNPYTDSIGDLLSVEGNMRYR
jgi:hypothetical protein